MLNGLKKCKVLVASFGSVLNDPTSRNCISELVRSGASVTAIHRPFQSLEEIPLPGLNERRSPQASFRLPDKVRSAFEIIMFRRCLNREIAACPPDVFVSIMFHPIALLSKLPKTCKVVVAILDIPPRGYSGALTERIIARGWRRLRQANLIWASDRYKAKLAMRFGNLQEEPIVCHNCPSLSYLPEPSADRDGWLRTQLRNSGASLEGDAGCVVLRAGAIGPCGGIEETLTAMRDLPADHVFLMMGRPSQSFKKRVLRLITELKLTKRAFLWDRVTDEVWKSALRGADVGHMIHGPFSPGLLARAFELNSSLSNHRLFQYMAAGLPIISYDDPRLEILHTEVDCFRVARVERLADTIGSIWRALGDDVNLRRKLGHAGRTAYLKQYHWEHQFQPVMNRLNDLLGSPSSI